MQLLTLLKTIVSSRINSCLKINILNIFNNNINLNMFIKKKKHEKTCTDFEHYIH